MRNRFADYEASLVIRLTGAHDVIVEIVGTVVQIMFPGAVVTITDKVAMHGYFRAWVESRTIAERAFIRHRVAPRYPSSRPTITAAVRASYTQPEPVILAKTPDHSPSRCGQVVVRVGRLTIVCDDHVAWTRQFEGWWAAYEQAATLWPMASAQSMAERITERVWREVHEGPE